LFWRNMQQIPLYYSPVAMLGIIMSNMDTPRRMIIRRISILSGIMAIYWILLFTDPYHHLIREKVWLEPIGEFERVQMSRTSLGHLFFSLNNVLALWGLLLLIVSYRKATGIQKMQYLLIMAAILFPFVFPWLARIFNLRLTVALSMLPSSVFIFCALHMYKFLQVRPLAKEKVLEHMAEGILIADEKGQIIDANPAARIIGNLTDAKMIGAYLSDLFKGHPNILELCAGGEQGKTEAEIGGQTFEVRFVPIHMRRRHTGSLLIFNDITDRKNFEKELIRRASTDGLTELSNRIHFLELMDKARAECAAAGEPVTLILIDLDHFKEINDQYGHLAGDRVLKNFAESLREAAGEAGIAGRIGGEEFAVLLPRTDGQTGYKFAEELRQRVQRKPLLTTETADPAEDISYTISIGVAELSDPRMTNEAWFKLADDCLYASKQNGRNRTTLA